MHSPTASLFALLLNNAARLTLIRTHTCVAVCALGCRWWDSRSEEVKAQFRQFVASGQLEFVGGGWSQNDEANPSPLAVISQMSSGHGYLKQHFNFTPSVGWQIDPFGHSSVTPSLFASMGFRALVLNRLHHKVKTQLKNTQMMEFLWQGAPVSGSASSSRIFTHVLHSHYSAPNSFDWENWAPRTSPDNVKSRAQELVAILKQRAVAYRSRRLLVPWGDDFKFRDARLQFSNMDPIVREIQSNALHYGMNVSYSTVSEYLNGMERAASKFNVRFPVVVDDFFPYADNEDSYWTGYYTTRPTLKSTGRR